jgi:fatty-acyl-CoA synthase
MIKTGGANVSPLEIEAALDGFPGLRMGQAVGVPHPALGEMIVLCVTGSRETTLDPEALRAHLREQLAPYKVPRRVLVFGEDELSFTGNQKLQVAPLRERALTRLQLEGAEIAGFRYQTPDSSDVGESR